MNHIINESFGCMIYINMTDFEEVVKLDGEYIDRWDIGMDIKILLKTLVVVFCGKGAE